MKENAVKTVAESLKNAFGASPLPLAVFDKEFNLEYANGALIARFPDISNKLFLYSLFKDIDEQVILNYLISQKTHSFTHDLPDQKGAIFTLTAIFDGENFEGFYAIISPSNPDTSIFSQKDAFESQNALNREFRDRITMMFSSIYALSHTENFEPEGNAGEFINSINQNCFQLLRVSDNLAKIMRLSANEDHANFALVNYSNYVKKLVEAIIRMDNKNLVPIKLNIEEEFLPAEIDLARMEFALSNIILNSIKYTREGNEISITLKKVGNNAVLTVSDKGIGIPKDILAHVGEPYFSYSHGGKFEAGFGIGLFIAKKYIASNAGLFSIQSKENEGTLTTVSIPLSSENSDPNNQNFKSPPAFEPHLKFSQTSIQLSEVCFYPVF